jgi:hypothetical protein
MMLAKAMIWQSNISVMNYKSYTEIFQACEDYKQGYVIVKPNILSFSLICGYGYLFFQYALTWFRLGGVSKWFMFFKTYKIYRQDRTRAGPYG